MFVHNSSDFQSAMDATGAGGILTVGPGVTGDVMANYDDMTLVGKINSAGQITMGSGVTHLTLIASVPYGGNFNVIGNDLGDTIVTRGLGDNNLTGGTGNDHFYVAGGFDVVHGGGGFDTLTVDFSQAIDPIQMSGSGSSGTINAGSTPDGIEMYVNYSDIAKVVLTYGSGDDVLNGTPGADTLNGGAGADTMTGGAGDDTYIVDNTGDIVLENPGEGHDIIKSSVTYTLSDNVERLVLTGADSIDGTGNNLANTIVGNSGDNVIDGKESDDSLTGGGGHDTFVFDTDFGAPPPSTDAHPLAPALIHNVDTITDFSVANDVIDLDHSVFGNLKPGGLSADHFALGGPTLAGAQILYVSWTGNLLYDDDGAGPDHAVQFAHLATGLALTAADFVVI